MVGPSSFPALLSRPFLCDLVRVDGTGIPERQVRFLISLTCFENSELLAETLDRSLTDEVRVHETVSVIWAVGSG